MIFSILHQGAEVHSAVYNLTEIKERINGIQLKTSAFNVKPK